MSLGRTFVQPVRRLGRRQAKQGLTTVPQASAQACSVITGATAIASPVRGRNTVAESLPIGAPMDRIAGMEAFVAVVEAGGFQAAARQLGISRALVSKRLSALERILGVQLLHRTTRRLSVTGPGSAFYESCQRYPGRIPPCDRRADPVAAAAARHAQGQRADVVRPAASGAGADRISAPASRHRHPADLDRPVRRRSRRRLRSGAADRRPARLLADRPSPLPGSAPALCRSGLSGPGGHADAPRGARWRIASCTMAGSPPAPAGTWPGPRGKARSTFRRRYASTMATC